MAKNPKSKPKAAEPAEEQHKENGSTDVFKLLFGRFAQEEAGLGLGSVSNPQNGESEIGDSSKKKKKKRDKSEKSHLEEDVGPTPVDEEKKKKKKKKKREKSEKSDLEEDVGPTPVDEEKKRKKMRKELDEEAGPTTVDDVDLNNDNKKKKKKKKEEEEEEEEKVILEVGLPGKDDVGKEEVGRSEEGKRKKKRKRDEIEEEYEVKRYGAMEKEATAGGETGNKRVGEKRKSIDDPATLLVSKEGFDDESKLLRTIFVGNLPLKLKKKALFKEFSVFGEVESVRIRSVPLVDSKTPRKGAIFKGKINDAVDSVHAYVVYKDEKSAQASLSHNMAVVEENHIRVDMACPPRKKLKGDSAPLYDSRRTIFVGNLPFDVKDEELYQLFCGINQLESSIEAIRVIRDPNTSIGKGVGYVLCKTRDAANLILKKKYLKLRDRELRLYHAKADATTKKRDPAPSSADDHPAAKRLSVRVGGSDNKTKSILSYQGLQASKSNKKKEGFRPKPGQHGKQKLETVNTPEVKQRKTKRPAVAARKAKALKAAASPKHMGKKRKPESRTPESLKRNKKARRK